ncbi:MAG: methylmalonyl Co-A mutase-associated GTPase MeaB [Candidatus Binatia bacterium]
MARQYKDSLALTEAMLGGDRVALARLITIIENRRSDTATIMSRVYEACGKAFTIGITGPPGAGKSTITSCLIEHLRAKDMSVGVVAIDPSSPFSGGSILGDRIRMQKHFLDPAVFIRSLSTRGSHGGLARSGRDVARVFDAFGKDVVIIETVGVGQTELDIMEVADTVNVVLVPESGDTVQVMKAGLLEIADVFVVNKADREGSLRMKTELKTMLSLQAVNGDDGWEVPVLMTQASATEGTLELLDACFRHRDHLDHETRLRRQRERLRDEVLEICKEELMRRLQDNVTVEPLLGVLESVQKGESDPYRAALEILDNEGCLSRVLSAPPEG